MFIQTERTPNPNTLKFLPGREVMTEGTVNFADAESAKRSPLAQKIFKIEQVEAIFFGADFITVTQRDGGDWTLLKPAILGSIMEHFVSQLPLLVGAGPGGDQEPMDDEGADGEVIAQIKDLIDTRIRPAATQDGGDVTYRDFKDGVVYLEFHGSSFSLLSGIENVLRNYVPEIEAVKDYHDALPKPGLETPEGKAIQEVLDERINPGVAAHGGHISLVDVKDDTVYIRLEGGCQGCGMADVTLKQGVATEIKRVAPGIINVLDVTDHADGTNPYYQPGKGGTSPY